MMIQIILKPSGELVNISIKELISAVNIRFKEFYNKKTEYEQDKQAMAEVLTNISHDIRTPLTVINGKSELLCKEAINSNLQQMALDINNKSNELVDNINDYFTLSKLSSNDLPVNIKEENITIICSETLLSYYDFLESNGFNVEINLPSEALYVLTNKQALTRILKNIIDNAIKHGGSGKFLALRILENDDTYVIEVEDHGKGMSIKQQKKIFMRNYTTAPKSQGSGLGLSIAKGLSEKIKARLLVNSIPDEKTFFSIILRKLEKS